MRQLHEIDVGCGQRDVLGEATPSVEAGLPLMQAHLVVAGLADEALSARTDEGHSHSIADAPSCDVRSDGSDRSRELVAGYVGEFRDIVVSVPGVPVTAAQASGLNLEDDAVGRGDGVGDIPDTPGGAEGVVQDCAHVGRVGGLWLGVQGEILR